jgi:7tm Odorant receptor
MFEESAPFKQFRLVFKVFGYIPKEIKLVHKIVAFICFIQFELFYGSLLFASLLQKQKSSTAFMTQTFQTPLMISFWCKTFYYFIKIDEVENFTGKMTKLFTDDKTIETFDNALKSAKRLSIVYSTVYALAVVFPPVAAFITRSPLVVMWKPMSINADLFFYFHWVQESIGNIYFAVVSSTIDLFPFCVMIMLQGYLIDLNEKFKAAKTSEDLFECVDRRIKVNSVIAEFQRIFSPPLFMQASALVGSFCATMLIVTTNVSKKLKS